jgi:hypothetical protein
MPCPASAPAFPRTCRAAACRAKGSGDGCLALENTLIRIGNMDYAKQNKSYGLTTLRDKHVDVEGGALKFEFKGKSGKKWNLQFRDRRIARIVKACQDIPGQHLFQYLDEQGVRHPVTSADVNSYLREITGREITAKDFRTWAGTVLAAMALTEFEEFDSQAKAKKNLKAAIEKVSARLGNTPTICRKCYIHPEILNGYLEGIALQEVKQAVEASFARIFRRCGPRKPRSFRCCRTASRARWRPANWTRKRWKPPKRRRRDQIGSRRNGRSAMSYSASMPARTERDSRDFRASANNRNERPVTS